MTSVRDITAIETLLTLLKDRVGSPVSYANLARDLDRKSIREKYYAGKDLSKWFGSSSIAKLACASKFIDVIFLRPFTTIAFTFIRLHTTKNPRAIDDGLMVGS